MKQLLKRLFRLNYIFYFFAGSVLFLYYPQKYERRVADAYVRYSAEEFKGSPYDKESVALHIMKRLHNNMVESGAKSIDISASWIEDLLTSPLMQYALSKDGACGGFTLAFAQVLQRYGYKVRPLQMKVKDAPAGHIVLEVNINDRWCIFDPLFNQTFRNPKNELASFTDLSSNWAYYQNQLVTGYDPDYNYEARRYTNWKRVPVFGSFAKGLITLFRGKTFANEFSFRSYLLNPRSLMFKFSLICLSVCGFLIFFRKLIKPVLINKGILKPKVDLDKSPVAQTS